MTQFTEDDMRVIRAMKEARDRSVDAFDVDPSLLQAAKQYAGLKAFFENVRLSHTMKPYDDEEPDVSSCFSVDAGKHP